MDWNLIGEILTIISVSGGILAAIFGVTWRVVMWFNKRENQKLLDIVKNIQGNQESYFIKVQNIETALSKILQISQKEWTRNGGSSGLDKITKTYEYVNTLLEKDEINFYLDNQPKYECDSNGHCHKVNYKWRDLTGLSENNAIGNQWMRAIHPGDRDRVHTAWENFIHKHYPFEENYRIVNLVENKVLYVRGIAKAIKNDNNIDLIVGTFEVIETKKYEQDKSVAQKQ